MNTVTNDLERENAKTYNPWHVFAAGILLGGIIGGLSGGLGGYYGGKNSEGSTEPSTICTSTTNADRIRYPEWDNTIDGIDPTLYGQWETVVPNNMSAALEDIIAMQTVHCVLLPSGKVLLASGSSWRNAQPTQTYPVHADPESGVGLFDKATNPFEWSKAESYYSQVNNVGIYDPVRNTYFRIPHPLPIQPDPDNSSWFLPTDLFCCGHQHLRDGNVMFLGGTQFYTPQRTGTKTTHIFNWVKELSINWTRFDWTQMPDETSDFYPWEYSGRMHQGRWYAHGVPLLDGRMAVLGGFIGFDSLVPDMYEFEMNTNVDFFDYDAYLTNRENDVNSGWTTVNVKSLPNSPFATKLTNPPPQASMGCNESSQNLRRCHAYEYDSFKLFPNNYLLKDGRIYLTREGDWNSLRGAKAACIRRVKNTYYMSIQGNSTNPSVSFSRGPDRPEDITMSGTTVLDPNSGHINLYGGMVIPTAGTVLPGLFSDDDPLSSDPRYANHYAGSRGTRKLEVFQVPANLSDLGSWTMKDRSYLGETIEDDRTMHYALILPTKEILIIGGGNYDFYGGIYSPLLLTPIYQDGKFTGKYNRTRLASAQQPRLYHSVAILLPDARIFTSGGNCVRAILSVDAPQSINDTHFGAGQPKPNLDRIQIDVYFFKDGKIGEGPNQCPAENWVMEIFTPPYLFIDGDRRTEIVSMEWISSHPNTYVVDQLLDGTTYYLMHSNHKYEIILSNLPTSGCLVDEGSLVLIKLGSVTHGWDSGQRLYSLPFNATSSDSIQFVSPDQTTHNIAPAFYSMFYVDCRGKPSISRVVRFDDRAESPV